MSDSRVAKVYRIYPILLHVSPAKQAEALRNAQAKVTRKQVFKSLARTLLAYVALLPIALFVCVVLLWLVLNALRSISSELAAIVSLGILTSALAMVVALMWWLENKMYTQAVRAELERTLGRTNCFRCGYSLEGLVAVEGKTQCPECSHLNVSIG